MKFAAFLPVDPRRQFVTNYTAAASGALLGKNLGISLMFGPFGWGRGGADMARLSLLVSSLRLLSDCSLIALGVPPSYQQLFTTVTPCGASPRSSSLFKSPSSWRSGLTEDLSRNVLCVPGDLQLLRPRLLGRESREFYNLRVITNHRYQSTPPTHLDVQTPQTGEI